MITHNIREFLESLPQTGRLLAIDYGEARLGVATCDEMRMIASPHSVYHRRNMRQDIGHLGALATEQAVVALVMGWPLALSGDENEACAAVRHFTEKLVKKTGLMVLLWDERLSTQAVTRSLSEFNISRRKAQSVDDKLAATYILQQVVDCQR